MAAKNIFIKNGLDRSKITTIGREMYSTETSLINSMTEKYHAEKKAGVLYYFDECDCEYGKEGCHKRSRVDFRHEEKIIVRGICDWCDKEFQTTLRCFDYTDILPFIVDDDGYETLLDVYFKPVKREYFTYNRQIQEMSMSIIKSKIIDYNHKNYINLYREWLKRLCMWDNTCSVSFWEGILKIEDNWTFLQHFSENFFSMWD